MKEVDFECCNKEYTIESDVAKDHKCTRCKAKFKKVKDKDTGVIKWEKKTKL